MIHLYDSADAMWIGAVRDCLAAGNRLESRVGGCREVVGWAGKLRDPMRNFVSHPARKLSATYAAAELTWYLSLERSVRRLLPYAPGYAKFTDDGENANGAYGDRWMNQPGFVSEVVAADGETQISQLSAAFQLLKREPNTRQCVVTMWDSADLAHAAAGVKHNDVPCTVALQFMVRHGHLHLCTFMRSNDAWLGMPYDVFCFTGIQIVMAAALGVDVGTYTHCVGSMHAYDKNEEKLREAIDMGVFYPVNHGWDPLERLTAETLLVDPGAAYLLRAERAGAEGRVVGDPPTGLSMLSTMVDDLARCLWHKTVPGFDARGAMRSKTLAEALP